LACARAGTGQIGKQWMDTDVKVQPSLLTLSNAAIASFLVKWQTGPEVAMQPPPPGLPGPPEPCAMRAPKGAMGETRRAAAAATPTRARPPSRSRRWPATLNPREDMQYAP